MSVVYEKEQSYFFSSDPNVGASQVMANGSKFSVALNNPILIPKGAIECSMSVNSAAIWYVNPNVSLELKNNTFRFTTTSAPAGTYTFTFPNGLYSLQELNSTISNNLINIGLPSNLFVLSGDNATQKTIITFLTSGDSIDFTVANSIRGVLGFNSAVYTAPSANYNLYSPNSAAFNADNSYLIASDLVSVGIPLNNQSFQILVNIPIQQGDAPGTQILYAPTNPVWFECKEIVGHPKQFIRFWLTNQSFVPVDTVGETWDFTVVIKWKLLLTNESLPLKPP